MDWDVFIRNRYGNQVQVKGVLVQGPHGVWIEMAGNAGMLCKDCEREYIEALAPAPPCRTCG